MLQKEHSTEQKAAEASKRCVWRTSVSVKGHIGVFGAM
jgi:hypothetical protein